MKYIRFDSEHVDLTLLIGGDDAYDDVSENPVGRFRDGFT